MSLLLYIICDLAVCVLCYFLTLRVSRRFCQRGSTFDNFFNIEGRENPNTTLSGPSSFKWRFAGGPILNSGLVAL